MTAEQSKDKFDNIKDFKVRFLFWQEHKNLIQQSFTDLQNELNELTGKQDQASNFRRGEIFRELQLIKPPQANEEKAFVAKYWIDFYQKDLETREDPIYSFDHYKQVYENKSRVALNLKDFIEREQKSMTAILENKFWETKIKLNHKEEIPIKDFALLLTNTLTINYAFIYEYVDRYSYNVDYPILARLLAPAQYSNFLKSKLDTLQDSKPASSKSKISDTGFNLGYTDTQLETLHGKLTNTKESENNLTEDQTIIYNHIEHLKGNNSNREGIMTTENFNLLFKDLCYLVKNDSLPEITKPLPQMGVSNQSIIYTVRLIHKDIFTTTKIKPSFIEFLQRYFQQLSNMENMKVAFSKKMPKKYPY
jgi:hypothetical protein